MGGFHLRPTKAGKLILSDGGAEEIGCEGGVTMKHFVLIHGAWHGGWCWEGVIRLLEKAGHTAEAPTMPGHTPADDRSKVTFNSYVEKMIEVLKAQRRPVILVGHSSAGFLLQAAASRVSDKIERLVFHNAFILPDGMAQFDLVPPEIAKAMIEAANASSDNSVPVNEDFVRNVLMAGDTKDVQDALVRRLTPQLLALFTTKVSTAAFSKLTMPRTVLFCKDDASLPPGAFLGMAQSLGKFDLIEIPGGHETLFTKPQAVARELIRIAG
ncbi:MAG TPA: alpha/beta fold hydrolase [Thermodesulfobacteriota bacterium]|nr:alpha/beta fold hydrolase [Thermodesulfobacteriota bacterium]